jgi:uncharacterized protein (TIGR02145 family)
MVSNLRIALASINNADHALSNPNANFSALGAVSSPDNSGSANYTAPKYYDPTCGATSAPTNCGSTDHTSSTFYGYLYNWCAAMGATTGVCTTSSVWPTDLAGNAANSGNYSPLNTASICPTGWRLPTGSATGELAVLNGSMYNGTLSPADTVSNSAHAINWQNAGAFKGTFSGSWDSSFNLQGQYTILWSILAQSDYRYNVFNTYFNASSVYTNNVASRENGYAVRCMTGS